MTAGIRLPGGQAPQAWRRQLSRSLTWTDDLGRWCGWVSRLAAVDVVLVEGPLVGPALAELVERRDPPPAAGARPPGRQPRRGAPERPRPRGPAPRTAREPRRHPGTPATDPRPMPARRSLDAAVALDARAPAAALRRLAATAEPDGPLPPGHDAAPSRGTRPSRPRRRPPRRAGADADGPPRDADPRHWTEGAARALAGRMRGAVPRPTRTGQRAVPGRPGGTGRPDGAAPPDPTPDPTPEPAALIRALTDAARTLPRGPTAPPALLERLRPRRPDGAQDGSGDRRQAPATAGTHTGTPARGRPEAHRTAAPSQAPASSQAVPPPPDAARPAAAVGDAPPDGVGARDPAPPGEFPPAPRPERTWTPDAAHGPDLPRGRAGAAVVPEDLERAMKRVLDDAARRHGIEV